MENTKPMVQKIYVQEESFVLVFLCFETLKVLEEDFWHK